MKQGQRMVKVQEIDPNWYEVRLDTGETGQVPANYIRPVDDDMVEAPPTSAPSVTFAASVPQKRAPDVELVAIADFAATSSVHLAINVGDELLEIGRQSKGWLEVQNHRNMRGTVPANYVQRINKLTTLVLNDNYTSTSGTHIARGMFVKRVLRTSLKDMRVLSEEHGELTLPVSILDNYDAALGLDHTVQVVMAFAGGVNKLALVAGEKLVFLRRLTSDWFEMKKPASGEKGYVPQSFIRELSDSKVVLKAKSAYKPESRNSDQLSLVAGEVVTLIKEVDSEWYEVENKQHKRGLVPKSFVINPQNTTDSGKSDAEDDDILEPIDTKVMVVRQDYVSGDPKQLDLLKGEGISLLRKRSETWYDGRKANGEEGLVPSSYLKPTWLFYQAVDSYSSNDKRILNFFQGDLFVVLAFESNEWMTAQCVGGAKGLVPASYVLPYEGKADIKQFQIHRKKPTDLRRIRLSSVASRREQLQSAATPEPKRTIKRRESFGQNIDIRNLQSNLQRHTMLPEQWSVSQVVAWVSEQNIDECQRCAQLFEENSIDGATLVTMNELDLANIGISQFGVRRKLVAAILQLDQSARGVPHHETRMLSMNRSKKVGKALEQSFRNGKATPEGLAQPPSPAFPRQRAATLATVSEEPAEPVRRTKSKGGGLFGGRRKKSKDEGPPPLPPMPKLGRKSSRQAKAERLAQQSYELAQSEARRVREQQVQQSAWGHLYEP